MGKLITKKLEKLYSYLRNKNIQVAIVTILVLLLFSGFFYPLVYFREASRLSLLATGRVGPGMQAIDETAMVFLSYGMGVAGLLVLYYATVRRFEVSTLRNVLLLGAFLLILSMLMLYQLEKMKIGIR